MRLTTAIALGLLIVGCTATADTTTTLTDSSSSTSIELATTTTESNPSTSSTMATTTTVTPAVGELVDFGPRAGDELMVIGVDHDDMLNLRAGPGTDQAVLEELSPTFEGLLALGETRQFQDAFWINVDSGLSEGWVSMSFIAYRGATSDATADIVSDFGNYPSSDSLEDLGLAIAESMASIDPPSRVVLVVPGSVGDLGEVVYDVVGLGDDSVRGLRIHVFANVEGDMFTLKSAEVTALCGRGVSEDGLCT